MIKKIYVFILIVLAFHLYSEENPYSKLEFSHKSQIVLRTGGETNFEVTVKLPPMHYIYVSHANSNGIGIITAFDFSDESGFQLIELNRPYGMKKNDEMVLKESGTFTFKIFELGTKKIGATTRVPIYIRTQVCKESKNEICFPPKTITKDLIIDIKEGKKMMSLRNIETIPWESNFKSTTSKAKSSNLNIYAIITEPSWCGACRYMEKEAFDKPDVQKVLKEKFIPWKVSDSEYGKVPTGSGSFGIPMFFVLDSSGKSLGKWSGARDNKGLLSLLKPFEKSSSNNDPEPIKPPESPAENTTQLEIISNDGSKCSVTYGKDYPWTAKKSGEFYNNGTFRFGFNNKELKVKQFTRVASQRMAYPITITTSGFRIEKKDLKEFWVAECKNSYFVGKVEGSDIEFTIEK